MDAEKALDHAWKYFHLHAQQRTTIFNYYVVFAGLLITGIASAARDIPQNGFLTASLGMLLTGLSYLFYKLDARMSFLIKRAEAVIGVHEPSAANLFKGENDHTKAAAERGQWTQGKVFRTMFAVMAAVGVLVFLLSIILVFIDFRSTGVVEETTASETTIFDPSKLVLGQERHKCT